MFFFSTYQRTWTLALHFLVVSLAGAKTLDVRVGGDFQAALDQAELGDTIVLQSGTTFRGIFTLRPKQGSADRWITVQSSDLKMLPPDGVRITPEHFPYMPVLKGITGSYVVTTQGAAHHYRFVGIRIEPEVYTSSIVQIGTAYEKSISELPHDIVLDRVAIVPSTGVGSKRGVALNGIALTVINSYIAGITSTWQDTQALCGWNTPGPLRIVNNYLEATGENIMLGGAVPEIYGAVPGDVLIAGNHIRKLVEWLLRTDLQIKNLIELKLATRVTISHNVLENIWPSRQSGYAVIIYPIKSQGQSIPWGEVSGVRMIGNIVRHAGSGIAFAPEVDSQPNSLRDVEVAYNLAQDIGNSWGDGYMFAFFGGEDIRVHHNTVAASGVAAYFDGFKTSRLIFEGNASTLGKYGVFSSQGLGDRALAQWTLNSRVVNNLLLGPWAAQAPSNNFAFEMPLSQAQQSVLQPAAIIGSAAASTIGVPLNVIAFLTDESVARGPTRTQVPSVLSFLPSKAIGRNFDVLVKTGGSNGIASMQVLVNTLFSAQGGCHIIYKPEQNKVWLLSSDLTRWLGGLDLGSDNTLVNADCRVDLRRSYADVRPESATLSLALEVNAAWNSPRNVYFMAIDRLEGRADWRKLGDWYPQ